MATKDENIETLAGIMKNWQSIEDESIKMTTEIIKKVDNPLVHLVMEIIRQDSVMHRRVQQLIIDNIEKQNISMEPEELADIWYLIEKHDVMEKKTIEMAKQAHSETNEPISRFLINYLLRDEQKHDDMLEELSNLKEK